MTLSNQPAEFRPLLVGRRLKCSKRGRNSTPIGNHFFQFRLRCIETLFVPHRCDELLESHLSALELRNHLPVADWRPGAGRPSIAATVTTGNRENHNGKNPNVTSHFCRQSNPGARKKTARMLPRTRARTAANSAPLSADHHPSHPAPGSSAEFQPDAPGSMVPPCSTTEE